MVFQRSNPFPKSIYENVAFGPRLNGTAERGDLDAIVEQALRRAALWDEVKDRLRQSALGLSGGQQQRLCIARALANEPEVLLLDEPASALDPIATQKVEELLYELKREITIVIVTHNLQQAARVSEQTAFFYLGRLIEAGETGRLFTAPREPAHRSLRHREIRMSTTTTESSTGFRHFHDDLEQLKQRLFDMSARAEALVDLAVDALLKRDTAKAETVIAGRPRGGHARDRDRAPRRRAPRAAAADGARLALHHQRHQDFVATSSASGTTPSTSRSRRSGSWR